MPKRAVLGFLTDQNVPEDVFHYLAKRRHHVARVRDTMPANSPDHIVAKAAMDAGLVLVSWDKDFNHQCFMKPSYASLSRIGFSCPEPEGAKRLSEVMDLIEFAFRRANGAPVRITIAAGKVLIRC